MSSDAFYDPGGPNVFEPTTLTVGPWDPGLQHGGPPASLLATVMEAIAPREGTRIAHFALDFLRPLPLSPMTVVGAIERGGKKVELLSATAAIDGKPALRASAWRAAVSPGRAPTIRLDEPPPPLPEAVTLERFAGVHRFGYGEALEWRFAEGGFQELGPAAAWTRLLVDVVSGQPASPLARVLAMVDSANGISAELDVRRYLFVPVHLSVSLTRALRGEWVGMRAVTQIAADGVGTTRARLFDAAGPLGEALQTLYVEPR